MHSAPGLEKKLLFINQNRFSIYGFGIISTMILMAGNVMFVMAHHVFWAYGLVAALTAFYLLLTYFVGLAGKEFDHLAHERLVAKWFDFSESASVDVFLPICGEPEDMVLNTWFWVRQMALRYENMNVFVLDDRPTETNRQNAEMMGFKYISRPINELKKAGNLRHAFAQTSGEFIVVFDADFCPRADFMIETLPYMAENRDVAIVQTPQFFDHYSSNGWLANAAGAVQELFYRLIQVNRDRFGGSVCVGTNAVYRREALTPFGGTAPVPYSEDVHTGFQLISAGWKLKYIPVILAEGVCPEKLQSFFTQQYRWAMGSISLFFSKKFWRAPITKMQRVCFLTGMLFYITTGIGVLIAPLPTIAMLSFFPKQVHWYNLLFAIPSLIFGTAFMSYWMRLPFSFDLIRVRQVSYFAHAFALIDHLTGLVEEWKPTGGAVVSSRYKRFKPIAGAIWIGSTALILLLVGWRIAQGHSVHDFGLVLLFTLFNAWLFIPILEEF